MTTIRILLTLYGAGLLALIVATIIGEIRERRAAPRCPKCRGNMDRSYVAAATWFCRRRDCGGMVTGVNGNGGVGHEQG